MKFIAFFLLLSSLCFSQENPIYERFKIENKNIIWQNIYQKDTIYNLENFKEKLKLNFTSNTTGFANNQKLKCKGLAIYMNSNFGFNFLIEEKDNKFRITVYDIYFEDNFQLNIGTVSTSQKNTLLSDMELRTSDKTFRKNSQSNKNMLCLDNYLLNIFHLKTDTSW
jgi:hypothetical protein